MKKLISLTILSSLFSLIACESQTKPDANEYISEIKMPQVKSIYTKKKGVKCDLISENENKEIFITSQKKEDKGITVSFYELSNKDSISVVQSVTLSDYTLRSFPLIKEENTFEGETIISHKDKAALTDEGEVIAIYGQLIVDKNLNGTINQKMIIKKEERNYTVSEYTEIAKLENCESFEANSLLK